MSLKRRWWDKLAASELKGAPWLSWRDQRAFHACATYFIIYHAAEAEQHGWQPAHLLSRHGLANAWYSVYSDRKGQPVAFCPDAIRWGDHAMIYASPDPCARMMFGRRAEPDGSTTVLRGESMTLMCGRHAAFCAATDCWPPSVRCAHTLV